MEVAATRVASAPVAPWKPSIAFLGYGAMAKAMSMGFQKAPAPLFSKYVLCTRNPSKLEGVQNTLTTAPVQIAQTPEEAVNDAEVIVLAVKPQGLESLLRYLPVKDDQLLVSIVVGWPIQRILDSLPPKSVSARGPRVIRCMPNTPLQVGKGCTLFSRCKNSTDRDADLAMRMFSCCGFAAELPESQIDGATGIAGSGPSYVAVFMEALADGAVKVGVPRDLALKLAAHTVEGAAAMCTENGGGMHPAIVKERVCSPGGTSICGVAELEDRGLRSAVMHAVCASTNRAKELSKL